MSRLAPARRCRPASCCCASCSATTGRSAPSSATTASSSSATTRFLPASCAPRAPLTAPTLPALLAFGQQQTNRKKEGGETYAAGLPPPPLFFLFFSFLSLSLSLSLSPLVLNRRFEVTAVLDRPLLSEAQSARLNPLWVRVTRAVGMPSRPIPFAQLDEQCHPPYVRIATPSGQSQVFWSTSPQRLATQPFNASYVVLAGLVPPLELCAVLRAVTVELHDRDRKTSSLDQQLLYGAPAHEHQTTCPVFSDFNAAVDQTMRSNPLPDQASADDVHPHGVATLNLEDCLLGV